MMNRQVFDLTHEEADLTGKLGNIIKNEINNCGGVIPFSRYMELALYYPQLGYYSNPRQKFGREGDFITAPILSSLFGTTLSKQINQIFGFGVKKRILEFGAGNGKLAADILKVIGNQLEHYYILELSADLVTLQRETISKLAGNFIDKIIWLNCLPDKFDGVILANEVLDAQPCELIRVTDKVVTEVGVTNDKNGDFVYCDYKDVALLIKEAVDELHLPDNYLTEWHTSNTVFIATLAGILNQGAILLIDYGYGQEEYYHHEFSKGRLRGFFRHHVLDSVLVYPGLIDITTSVDWTKVAVAAINHGLELIGYTTQASFLLGCGLIDQMSCLHAVISESEYLTLSNQVNQLIAPNQMGERFKVMALSKDIVESDWLGFGSGDLSYTL